MNKSSDSHDYKRVTYQPGVVLLAAQAHAKHIRQQDDDLKKEIARLMQFMKIDYEQARRYVLRSKGLLR